MVGFNKSEIYKALTLDFWVHKFFERDPDPALNIERDLILVPVPDPDLWPFFLNSVAVL